MKNSFFVIRDTREQKGWTFAKRERCLGTVDGALKTGDYTLRDYESVVAVERKATPSELAGNVFEARFLRELERLDSFEEPHVICEFNLDELIDYPRGSDVPHAKRKLVRVRGPLLLKRVVELQRQFKARWHFAGGRGRELALCIFKRVSE